VLGGLFDTALKDRAPTFALLLSIYLAGIAAGSYVSEKLTEQKKPEEVPRCTDLCAELAWRRTGRSEFDTRASMHSFRLSDARCRYCVPALLTGTHNQVHIAEL
jgi:hypothetical protein